MRTQTLDEAPRSHRLIPPRPVKMQICFSPDERAALTRLARERGYDSVAAFVRAKTLGSSRSERT